VIAMADPVIAQAHAWIAVGAAVAAVALGVAGLVGARSSGPTGRVRRWIDRIVLGLLGLVVAAALVGAIVLLVVGPPSDWLHLLYAAIALLAAPAARLIAGWRHSARVGLWMTAGSLVTLGALLRLWVTGG
jgi:hypothetical protein